MAAVLLFHHALGQTDGFLSFADALRAAGHTVHAPDLYSGKSFATLDEGMANARSLGFGALLEQGVAAAEGLPDDLVYAGFSLGVMPAQQLAQTRAGARGAVLLDSAIPLGEFAAGWPAGVPVQVHGGEADEFFMDEGDVDAARAVVDAAEQGELFLYPGCGHLFADASAPAHDNEAAALVRQRVLDFLARV
ncbi:dienelactone hydrolase family protein [Terrabacter carboxydivorans]|uniref:Dienelactone hydrolase family protein n=1 Tax=Terrabacter carboxydivorans TaxID=619730 RepID=A0ABP5YY18_9MICO